MIKFNSITALIPLASSLLLALAVAGAILEEGENRLTAEANNIRERIEDLIEELELDRVTNESITIRLIVQQSRILMETEMKKLVFESHGLLVSNSDKAERLARVKHELCPHNNRYCLEVFEKEIDRLESASTSKKTENGSVEGKKTSLNEVGLSQIAKQLLEEREANSSQ